MSRTNGILNGGIMSDYNVESIDSIVPQINFNEIDEIFHPDKKIRNSSKTPPSKLPKLDVELNSEQRVVMNILENNDISVLFGKAGSGKTMCATYYALSLFESNKIDNIYITRPTVSKENIGYLPGGIEDKMEPWMQPIYHNLYTCRNKVTIDNMIKKGKISIQPLSFMRGITFKNSILIVDECQNVDIEQMKMIVTRLGKGSKLILCGDTAQVDLVRRSNSGLQFIINIGENIDGFTTFELKTNHRHPIVDKFIDAFDALDLSNE